MSVKKVTVNIPEDQINFLQGIAKEENITFTDALRRAINAEKFFVDQKKEGGKILVEKPGQRIREVLRK